MSGTIVKCDGCETRGTRRAGHAAPDFWFFIITENRTPGQKRDIYVVYACSEACRDGMWKRGSGPGAIDEEGSYRQRARRIAKQLASDPPCPHKFDSDRCELCNMPIECMELER